MTIGRWLMVLVCACLGRVSAAENFIAPRASLVPGGVATLKLPGALDAKPVVSFNGKPVMVVRQASGWLASHYAMGVTHAQNVANGMRALDKATVRAATCLDCHYGSTKQGQFVTDLCW